MKIGAGDIKTTGGSGRSEKRTGSGTAFGSEFLDDEVEAAVKLGLVIEGGFEKVVVSFFVNVDKVRVRASDDDLIIFEGDELSFGNKGLKDGRSKDDFEFFLGIFPKTIEIHKGQ